MWLTVSPYWGSLKSGFNKETSFKVSPYRSSSKSGFNKRPYKEARALWGEHFQKSTFWRVGRLRRTLSEWWALWIEHFGRTNKKVILIWRGMLMLRSLLTLRTLGVCNCVLEAGCWYHEFSETSVRIQEISAFGYWDLMFLVLRFWALSLRWGYGTEITRPTANILNSGAEVLSSDAECSRTGAEKEI